MDYSKIISVTGLPGLYELINSKGDGAVVRSLDDRSTKFVSSRVHNFSHLESIEVFTHHDNINLADLFHLMEESKEPIPNPQNTEALKKYFEKIYPDMDFERVYTSDMKKMVKWFDILKKNNIEIKLIEAEEIPVEEEIRMEPVEEKTAKPVATAPKKAAAKKEKAVEQITIEKTTTTKKEKPAEQVTPKKTTTAKKEKPAEQVTPKKKAATKQKKEEKDTPSKKSSSSARNKKTAKKK